MAKKQNNLPRTFRDKLESLLIPAEWKNLFFKEYKIPGFVLVFWGVLTLIPTIKSSIDFWWDAAIYLGGNMALIGAILTSPWFGLLLIVSGLAYIIFVDEPQAKIGHPALKIAGWVITGAVFFAIFTVSIVSYVSEEIGPRHIYPRQREAIINTLRTVNAPSPHIVRIDYVASCFDCDGYAFDFAELINTVSGWTAIQNGTLIGPSRSAISLYGVAVKATDIQNKMVQTMSQALRNANIKFEILPGNMWPSDMNITVSARAKR